MTNSKVWKAKEDAYKILCELATQTYFDCELKGNEILRHARTYILKGQYNFPPPDVR